MQKNWYSHAHTYHIHVQVQIMYFALLEFQEEGQINWEQVFLKDTGTQNVVKNKKTQV